MRKEIKNLEQAIRDEAFKAEAQTAAEDKNDEKIRITGKRNKRKSKNEEGVPDEQQEISLSYPEFDNESEAEAQSKLISFPKETDPAKIKKSRKTKFAVAAFVLLLGVGVIGNWYYENSDISSSVKPLITSSQTKTLGEAEYVDATTQPQVKNESEYFSQARVDRETARDTSLEKLQAVIDSADESNEAKQTATEEIAKISNYISIENKIETLVTAKGVSNCIAVINEDGTKVDVIVDVEDLSDAVVLQIKEIAMQQLDCSFENVSIIQSN